MDKKHVFTTRELLVVGILIAIVAINLVQLPLLSSKDNVLYSALHRHGTYDIYEQLIKARGFNRKFNLTYALRDFSDNAVLYVPSGSVYLNRGGRDRYQMASMGNMSDIVKYSPNEKLNNLVTNQALNRSIVRTGAVFTETDEKDIYDPSLPAMEWVIYAEDHQVSKFILIIEDNVQHFVDSRLIVSATLEGFFNDL
ncbi:MAG: hypothetical protein R3313_01140 [Candidatus Saccharimonadales bacterium]|nr:hypothetical protein [Candidatus Saccharimonadales bacterium]